MNSVIQTTPELVHIKWLIDRLIGRLIAWLVDWLLDWSIDCLIWFDLVDCVRFLLVISLIHWAVFVWIIYRYSFVSLWQYHWMLIRQYICFTFAIRGDRRMPWVQLAGHAGRKKMIAYATLLRCLWKCEIFHSVTLKCTALYLGSFQTGECGTVLKKFTPEEHHCFQVLMDDVVKPFVPLYVGIRQIDGEGTFPRVPVS